MFKNFYKNNKLHEGGFTIVELTIVLIISGLIMSSIALSARYYIGDRAHDKTFDIIETSKTALFLSQYIYGYYPCPADPTLAPNDPNYGRADCDSPNVMKVQGRDVDGDGTGEDVLIGALPFNTLLDPDGDINTNDAAYPDYAKNMNPSLDGWHNKMTYAVTSSQALDADMIAGGAVVTFDQDVGAIDVVDENNLSILNKPGIAHLVIVSHGENGMGAYTESGEKIEDCIDFVDPDTTPILGVGGLPTERDNCDFEIGPSPRAAIFLSGLRKYDEDDPYDDITKFLVTKVSEMWTYTDLYNFDNDTPDDASDDILINQVANTNAGNVGIGIKNPAARLHVQGDIQAIQMHAESVCDGQGADCMPAAVLGGEVADMQCPDGQVVTHIAENKVTCSEPFLASAFGACDAGKYLIGISSKYGPICDILHH